MHPTTLDITTEPILKLKLISAIVPKQSYWSSEDERIACWKRWKYLHLQKWSKCDVNAEYLP